jgi:hypothetical protein
MKEIKKVNLKNLMLVTGIIGLVVGFLYAVIVGVLISLLVNLPTSSVLDIVTLTLAFGIGSAVIWLVYGLIYNYIAVPLTGGIKIKL